MEFSLQQLADACGCSYSTIRRRIDYLKKSNKFTPTSIGKFYNERDARLLSELIGFTIKKLNT